MLGTGTLFLRPPTRGILDIRPLGGGLRVLLLLGIMAADAATSTDGERFGLGKVESVTRRSFGALEAGEELMMPDDVLLLLGTAVRTVGKPSVLICA